MKTQPFLYVLAAVTVVWTGLVSPTPSQADTSLREALRERDSPYRYRIFIDPNEAMPGCRRNFSEEPCEYDLMAFVLGPMPLGEDAFASAGLPYTLRNMIGWPAQGSQTRHCTTKALERLDAFLREQTRPEKRDNLVAVLLPADLDPCFGERQETPMDYVLLFHGGVLIALIDCFGIGGVPNPNCTMNFYISGGLYQGTIGNVPLRNVATFIDAAPRLIEATLAHELLPRPGDFVWEPLPVVAWDESVRLYIASTEEQLSDLHE